MLLFCVLDTHRSTDDTQAVAPQRQSIITPNHGSRSDSRRKFTNNQTHIKFFPWALCFAGNGLNRSMVLSCNGDTKVV
jgi:hypothetical protein